MAILACERCGRVVSLLKVISSGDVGSGCSCEVSAVSKCPRCGSEEWRSYSQDPSCGYGECPSCGHWRERPSMLADPKISTGER